MDDAAIRDLLQNARTVAVVGCSDNPAKAANSVPAFLQSVGFRIIPVNPLHETVLGERCYPSLDDVDEPYDLVDIFRPPKAATEVVRQAIANKAPAVWLQLGIRSAEAEALARDAGIPYVEDRCTLVEVRRHGIHH